MIDKRTGKPLSEIPELNDGQIYIYAMVNDIGKIKIGKTGNIQQRYNSLGGSNSQGHKILGVFCSPATYLTTLECILHEWFDRYRIPRTEWFYGEDLRFEDVCDKIEALFSSSDYERCNAIRENFIKAKRS